MTRVKTLAPCALGLLALTLLCVAVSLCTGTDFLSPNAPDVYTRQALRWREGEIRLAEDVPSLELAIYEGGYYVSFPPVPTLPMFALTFLFGARVPAGLVVLCYFLLAYVALYALLARTLPRGQAALAAVCVQAAGSLLDIAVSGGGVAGGSWYQAQMLAYLLTLCALLGLTSKKPRAWALGLVAIALAVGCRPLNAVWVPALLLMLYQNLRAARHAAWRALLRMARYVAVPLLIAAAYAAYNMARFGDPLEFGHSYLPEFTRSGEPMLSFRYFWGNLRHVLTPPTFAGAGGWLTFPIVGGFAVYLTNPVLFYGAGRFVFRAARRKADALEIALFATGLLHLVLLLTHRTNGGWQFGTRYLCDALPGFALLWARNRTRASGWEGISMIPLAVFCVLGTIAFHSPLP